MLRLENLYEAMALMRVLIQREAPLPNNAKTMKGETQIDPTVTRYERTVDPRTDEVLYVRIQPKI